MLGTDHPIPWEEHPVDHIFATATLSDDDRVAILGAMRNGCLVFRSTHTAHTPVCTENLIRVAEVSNRVNWLNVRAALLLVALVALRAVLEQMQLMPCESDSLRILPVPILGGLHHQYVRI
jgi:hypothetical protein